MAFVVKRKDGSWEIRESRHTEKGPRAFTLVTLREETPDLILRARERSKAGFLESELRRKLDEAGVPPVMTDTDRAARQLLFELETKGPPSEGLRKALLEKLGYSTEPPHADEDEAGLQRIGRIFEDVLDLAVELPYEPADDIAQVPLRDLVPEGQAAK
jgi:hypothetical protein